MLPSGQEVVDESNVAAAAARSVPSPRARDVQAGCIRHIRLSCTSDSQDVQGPFLSSAGERPTGQQRRPEGVNMDTQVLVTIDEQGADGQRLEALSLGLRGELLTLDVDDVRRVPGGEPPPGTRAIDLAAVGALMVTLSGSVELVGRVVGTIRSWLARGSPDRMVELSVGDKTLKLSAASPEQQERLVREFLESVGSG